MKKNKRSKKKSIRSLAVLLSIGIAIAFYVKTYSSEPSIGNVRPIQQITSYNTADLKTIKAQLSDIDISNELMLVNKDNTIDESFAPELSDTYGIIPKKSFLRNQQIKATYKSQGQVSIKRDMQLTLRIANGGNGWVDQERRVVGCEVGPSATLVGAPWGRCAAPGRPRPVFTPQSMYLPREV